MPSITSINRRQFSQYLLAGPTLAAGAARTNKPQTEPAPLPTYVRPQFDSLLPQFGQMVQAYAPEYDQIIIEIDIMPNNSGNAKELPAAIGSFFRNVVDRMGPPFRTFHAWDRLTGPLLVRPSEPQQRPPANFKIVGSLVEASETAATTKHWTLNGTGGKGDGSLDKDKRATTTAIAVECTLEDRNGFSVFGATSMSRVLAKRTESGKSFSIYFAGSGFGVDSRTSANITDIRDILWDVAAVSAVHLLSAAVLCPGYRLCPPSVYGVDDVLNKRYRNLLNELARQQLEQALKRLLFVDGRYGINNSALNLTPEDRAIIMLAMGQRGLNFSDRVQLADFTYQVWADLAVLNGADRVRALKAEIARNKAEALLQAAQQPPELGKDPAEFNWPSDTTPFVVLDLSPIAVDLGQQVLAALRRHAPSADLRFLPANHAIVGARLPADQVQRALRLSSLPIEAVWVTKYTRARVIARVTSG